MLHIQEEKSVELVEYFCRHCGGVIWAKRHRFISPVFCPQCGEDLNINGIFTLKDFTIHGDSE